MATPPVFPHKGEALAMLDEEFARVDLPTPAGLQIEKQKRPGSQKLAWWHGDPDAADAVGGAAGPADAAATRGALQRLVLIEDRTAHLQQSARVNRAHCFVIRSGRTGAPHADNDAKPVPERFNLYISVI